MKSPGGEPPNAPDLPAERPWEWGDATDWTNSLLDFGSDALNLGGGNDMTEAVDCDELPSKEPRESDAQYAEEKEIVDPTQSDQVGLLLY